MNTLHGTQLHIVTLDFIILDALLVVFHLPFLSKQKGERHAGYLLMLLLLLCFNITNGFFPDINLSMGIRWQYIIAYGSAYVMGAYVPYYFFTVFDLKELRFHALYGVPLIDLGCFLLFNVLLYLFNGDIILDSRLAVIVPFSYGFVVLTVMLKAIRSQYRETRDKQQYREQLAVFAAILPWQAMAIFAFYPGPQYIRVIMANLGMVVISFFLAARAFGIIKKDFSLLAEMKRSGNFTPVFEANCAEQELTGLEIQITLLLRKGYTYARIAKKLNRSYKSIDSDIQKLYEKVHVRNKMELINKLWGLEEG